MSWEDAMLAEIFLLRLEAEVRTSERLPHASGSRFVPFDHSAHGAFRQPVFARKK